ncbi:MAG: hypothetical protein OEM59_08590 [Rhodospirillales bacterium]|nr:hypothetical protein [Rhodospirillales bacterium]
MSNYGRGLVALAGALAITTVLAATPASATDVDCSSQLTALSGEISGADFANEMDRNRLLGKVTAAGGKLGMHKFEDAEQKIYDIITKVTALRDAPKEKINDGDANDILDAADDVLACIPNP